jgi:hypothetical protein
VAAFVIEPLVAGELGSDTVLDPATHPPKVSAVEYVLDSPTTEDLIESFPVFLVSDELAEQLRGAGLDGFDLAPAQVVRSREYVEAYGNAPHKQYQWLRPRPADAADCWLDETYRLCVRAHVARA